MFRKPTVLRHGRRASHGVVRRQRPAKAWSDYESTSKDLSPIVIRSPVATGAADLDPYLNRPRGAVQPAVEPAPGQAQVGTNTGHRYLTPRGNPAQ